ncbi:hypothetical protein [Halococcus thailandensis]|uniref:Uncharacterized protein n=1 Tax=Halococcus thailandensis JCM 13552 TaxID=1227457 RepID=M0NIG2_9EURY|nr:hypothetical protein [Halococcus thailandensis]EMA56455.1 hypothetical protein C451_01983 [Halococcus thailandensis JCM 13552]
MPDQSAPDGDRPPHESERATDSDSSSDQILNPETRRALREWGRRCYAVGVGALTAVFMLIPTTLTTVRPSGVLFHLAVTLVSSLSLPVVTVYVAARAYGLSHHEVVSVARHAAREGAAATATLGAHQRAEQPTEPIEPDATQFTDTNTDTDETQ